MISSALFGALSGSLIVAAAHPNFIIPQRPYHAVLALLAVMGYFATIFGY